jgi:undecaprenol kinase
MIFVCRSAGRSELTAAAADSADAPLLEAAREAGNAANANATAAIAVRIFTGSAQGCRLGVARYIKFFRLSKRRVPRNQLMKNRPFYQRLGFAASGIAEAWRRERSFRTQVVLGLGATALTVVFAPSLLWAAVIGLSIGLVLALELLNTAVETLIDHLHPETAAEVRLAKDIAAGAVLVASFAAASIGLLMIVSLFWH